MTIKDITSTNNEQIAKLNRFGNFSFSLSFLILVINLTDEGGFDVRKLC